MEPAQAAEEIKAFDVVIKVQPDGALEVVETITVTVEGEAIKRGIVRELPLEGPERGGKRGRVTLDVLSVTRNGTKETYRLERDGTLRRIRIGDKDVFLPVPSEQHYSIAYLTQGQLSAFDGYDELYWNVTGDQWAFPILAAEVTVHLPKGAEIKQFAVYTGPTGGHGTDFEVLEAKPGLFRARTTAPLGRGEGFTVAVAWPAGLVQIPDPKTLLGQPQEEVAALGASLLGGGILFLFWMAIGRDPSKQSLYPRIEPPKGIGPAAARYLQRQAYDDRCLTAAILSMAVKGALRIEELGDADYDARGGFQLVPLGGSGKNLTPAELAAYWAMFPGDYALVLKRDKGNGGRMDRARKAVRAALREEHYGASFKRNGLYTASGLFIGLVIAMGLFWLSGPDFLGPALVWAGMTMLAGSLVLVLSVFWQVFKDGSLGLSKIHARRWLIKARLGRFALPVGLLAIIAVTVLYEGQAIVFERHWTTGDVVVLAGGGYGLIAALFHLLMARPTKAGRKLMDEVEGFRLYLEAAETGNHTKASAPKPTAELFERYLPYAVALGVTAGWSQQFSSLLAGTSAPFWFVGYHAFDPGHFEDRLGDSVAATSEPPSNPISTHGGASSGGGFSGGGGGGGGGGGW